MPGSNTYQFLALGAARAALDGALGAVAKRRNRCLYLPTGLSANWAIPLRLLNPCKVITVAAVRPGLGRGHQLLLAFSRSMLGTAACSCRA